MKERWIVIPGWEEFQHRDAMRSSVPKWIKVYTELLHKDEYLELTMAQRGLLHGLWLMYAASKSEGVRGSRASLLLNANQSDAKYFRRNLEVLENAGFIRIVASRPASKVASKVAGLEEIRKEEKHVSVSTTNAQPSPFKEELVVARIIQVTGDMDEDALNKIRGYARRLPEGSIAKVLESVQVRRPRNRVGYVLAGLASELRERAA